MSQPVTARIDFPTDPYYSFVDYRWKVIALIILGLGIMGAAIAGFNSPNIYGESTKVISASIMPVGIFVLAVGLAFPVVYAVITYQKRLRSEWKDPALKKIILDHIADVSSSPDWAIGDHMLALRVKKISDLSNQAKTNKYKDETCEKIFDELRRLYSTPCFVQSQLVRAYEMAHLTRIAFNDLEPRPDQCTSNLNKSIRHQLQGIFKDNANNETSQRAHSLFEKIEQY